MSLATTGTSAGEAPTAPPADRGRAAKQASPIRRPLWLLVPPGVLVLVVIGIPLVLAVVISLLDLDQYTLRSWFTAPFVGLGNYVEAVTEAGVLHAIWISASTAVLTTLITLPIGIAAALAAHNRLPALGLIRSVFLLPYVIPAFVTATVWRTMLQPDGAIEHALGLIGVTAPVWLNGSTSYWTMILVNSWSSWPFIYLLSLAGLQGLSAEVMEAASLDGAGWASKLRHVVLPQIRGQVALAAVLGTLSHLNNFTLPFILFGNPAPEPIQVLPMLTYSTSFLSVRFGLGSAMALVSVVVVAIPLVVYLRATRLETSEGTVGDQA